MKREDDFVAHTIHKSNNDQVEPVDLHTLTPDQKRAIVTIANSWLTGSRVWRCLFWSVTTLGAIAATFYYAVSGFDLINGKH
jgi:hypothetical protein